MDDKFFAEHAAATLAAIESALESAIELHGADLDFECQPGGILQIEFADDSQIVINSHRVAQEIWVAARAGGFHFRFREGRWEDTRDGEELFAKLTRLLSEQAGQPISLPTA